MLSLKITFWEHYDTFTLLVLFQVSWFSQKYPASRGPFDLTRDLCSQGNSRMTLLRKVINHIFGCVGDENDDTDVLHPAFNINKQEVRCMVPCRKFIRIACLIGLQDNEFESGVLVC